VECSNNRLVSRRQKTKGMSWSTDGSFALAIIKALQLNGKLDSWLSQGEISFDKPGGCPIGDSNHQNLLELYLGS
jgi:hypothetical protein